MWCRQTPLWCVGLSGVNLFSGFWKFRVLFLVSFLLAEHEFGNLKWVLWSLFLKIPGFLLQMCSPGQYFTTFSKRQKNRTLKGSKGMKMRATAHVPGVRPAKSSFGRVLGFNETFTEKFKEILFLNFMRLSPFTPTLLSIGETI